MAPAPDLADDGGSNLTAVIFGMPQRKRSPPPTAAALDDMRSILAGWAHFSLADGQELPKLPPG